MTPPSTNPVDDYAKAVVGGDVPAGKYHRLACKRHLADRARENTPGFPYRFVWEERDEKGRLKQCALRFIEFARQCKHYKGKRWARKAFDPSPNQVFRLGSIFGWRHIGTGYRRFTTAYNEIPRKNGKSFEAAVVGIYVTFFEGEPGADGYCIATKEKQAKIVFGDMKKMVKSSPGLASRIQVNAANLHLERTSSKLEPIGSDSDTTDGLNPYLIITDELHAFKVRGLLDVMESATGARDTFLHFQITTAGDNPVSPCGDQHDYACRILDGVLEDDDSTLAFFAFIAHADVDDDWTAEATWIKANPHYGISVNPDDLRKLAAKAKSMPSAAAEFQQKRLNLWVNATAPCLAVDGWKLGQSNWSIEEMKGQAAYIGIDLAAKIDLCSMSVVFPPTKLRKTWRVIQRIWTPNDTMVERALRDRAPYSAWKDAGWLTAPAGKQINHGLVRAAIKEACGMFAVQKVGFDPWHVDNLVEQLMDDGMAEEDLLAVPQTFAGMSSACLRVQAEILDGNFDARGCPVTAWSVSNVVPNRDGKENLMFAKGKSRGRIDPVISLTIPVALWLKLQPSEKPKRERGRAFVYRPDGLQRIDAGDVAPATT